MIAIVNISYAFDVSGFKDGMSKKTVMEKAKSYNFDEIKENEDGSLMLYDRSYLRFYTLGFTDNKLVTLDKHGFQPSMSNYILLFKELVDKYGSKTSCKAETRLGSDGEEKTIRCWWREGKEDISIAYDIFTTNESLSVFYSAVDKYIPRKVK